MAGLLERMQSNDAISEEELPDYDAIGALGPPPEYKNTDSAAGYRTTHEAPPDTTNTEGAPPSYESMYGQIKDEWFNSETFSDFLRKLGAILLASIACTLLLVLLIIIPIAYIVIGAMYWYDCPINRWIPIYLVVAGCLGLLQNGLMLIRKAIPFEASDPEHDIACYVAVKASLVTWSFVASIIALVWFLSGTYWVYSTHSKAIFCVRCLEMFIGVVAFIWFIIGTIWVYSIMTHVCWNKKDLGCYCHKTCYLFAFWMITITYILLIIMIVALCIFICCTLNLYNRRSIEPTQDGYENLETSTQGGDNNEALPDWAAQFGAGFQAGAATDPYQGGIFLGDHNHSHNNAENGT